MVLSLHSFIFNYALLVAFVSVASSVQALSLPSESGIQPLFKQIVADGLYGSPLQNSFDSPPNPGSGRRGTSRKTRYFESGQHGVPYASSAGLRSRSSTGRIAIHLGNVFGPRLGYLKQHELVSTKKDATLYSYTVLGGLIDIYDADTEERMCLMAGFYGPDLNPGMLNFHLPRSTDLITVPGDVPHFDRYSQTLLETSIFSLDRMTNEITVNWVNIDGSYPMTYISLYNDEIFFTGDFLLLREHLEDNLNLIVFKWIESD